MKNVSIALLGCGTVGKGVVDLLQMNGHLIAEQTDTHIHIKHVLVRDIEKYKNVGLDENLHLTDNFNLKSHSISGSIKGVYSPPEAAST